MSRKIVFTDEFWMARAQELARRGVGLTHPNPAVGAVIVKSGRVIGEGFHVYESRDHAEIVALKKAGRRAKGATLYVTLEPCRHTGRTGPCTNALLSSGIKRVVGAMRDPHSVVAGQGFQQLRRAGVRVTVGVGEAAAQTLNEPFTRWIVTKRPFVTLKAAITLDGQISARASSVTWITSAASRKEVQRMRHDADAILTGIGTVLADDPRLNDRSGLPRRRKLLRVVLDSRLRTPLHSELVESAQGDLLIFTAQRVDSPKARALARAGAEVVRLPTRRGRIDLNAVLRELGRREILSLMIEAGSGINGAMLEAGLVDKMVLFYAPKIMGAGGVPMARIASSRFSKAAPLTNLKLRHCGPDFMVEGYFRRAK
ncbi:MAG TPA: bifunctional diaminohydroxyphosphoribosylaminopyrimidine deaminase/5-amino-6-(5-phosphoribosylamino)uracil reductase RibD [Candidatus Acidoferrales bacterium]